METSEVSGTLESEGQRLLRERFQKITSSVVCGVTRCAARLLQDFSHLWWTVVLWECPDRDTEAVLV